MITTRQQLGEFALRALGAPVINVEVADEQLADAIESSILLYNEYHWDGVERDYVKHQVTEQDRTNGWLPIDEDIYGIMRVLPWYPAFADGLFDITYQLRMNDLRNLSSGTMNYFTTTMEYLSLLDMLLRKEKQFRFNRRMGRIYLDVNWSSDIKVGDYVIVECYRALNTDEHPNLMNDPWLKEYTIAMVKRYWGANLRKYQGIQLPGGVILDGERIHREATEELKALKEELINDQAPLNFLVG